MSNSEAPPISSSKLEKLIEKIKSDANLASKLGLMEEVAEKKGKRKRDSPVKFNKVAKTFEKGQPSNSQSVNTGPPDENASVKKTSKRGASGKNLARLSPPEDIDVISSEQSAIESEEEEAENSSDGFNDMENLENLLCGSDDDLEEEEEESEDEPEKDESFDVLGGPKKGLWTPSKKALEFYLKAADIELKPDLIKEIKEQYAAEDDLDAHFCPPRFPPSLWATVQSSQADIYRLKSLFKVQDNLFLSLKPLLDCLAVAEGESKSKIIQAIQLISSSNLLLNRFRRSTIAPHLKNELRKQVLSLPVTHDSFFGQDFCKATDNLVKEQSAIEKVVFKKPWNQRLSMPSTSKSSFHAQGGRGFYSNKRGRGGRGKKFLKKRGGFKNDSFSSQPPSTFSPNPNSSSSGGNQ